MKTKLLMLAVACGCTFAGNAMSMTMTKAEYKAEKTRISAEYKVSKEKCSAMKANAKDICVSEAKGVEKIAKAEAEAMYEPSAKHTKGVAMAKADAMYDTAKEKCDDLSGNAKDVCVKDAKAIFVRMKEDAKVAKAATDTTKTKNEKMADVKKDAADEKREAAYKAARERCDSLSGVPKDTCQNDAKVKFGMK